MYVRVCRPIEGGLYRCLLCMYMHAWACKTWGSGAWSPRKFWKLDALRLLLRLFWDWSRVIVATWLAKYCIQFLAVHICICYADIEFAWVIRIKVLQWQISYIFKKMLYDSRALSCCLLVGGDRLGQLVNFREPETVMFSCMSFHHSSINCLCTHFTFIQWSSMNKWLWTNSFWQWWFSMAARLVNHLQIVGHLNCIARQCVKSFGGQKV